MLRNIEKLTKNSLNPKLIGDAFDFAKEAYMGRQRLSGENYIDHAVRVALMLENMNLDSTTIAFGILHNVIDDVPGFAQKVEIEAIEKKFGKEMAKLIGSISQIGRIRFSLSFDIRSKRNFSKERIENLRRMFLALSGDLRVVLVELVSRLDGLNLLHHLSEDKQKIFALETLQIFVPIASRLGLSDIRRKMEDVAFSYLFPGRYAWLESNIKEKYEEREKYLKKFIPHIGKIFKKERINVLDINYRAKSYWSTYLKLLKRDMDFDKIHDLLALRIIANDVGSCYKILGVLHKHFKPISEEINDYIAKPKLNGYRSLHTNIFLPEGKVIEVQIRTEEMHKEAEFGVCAHWSYKEKIDLSKEKESFRWMENRPKENSVFWKTFKINFFPDKVFCFTPKGDVIALTKGSTPVDFAYAIHSDVGNHCDSAKVDGKLVPLNYPLENGDVVEIITNKKKVPSKDWLRFAKTSLAISHIKKMTGQDKPIFRIPLPGFIRKKIQEISDATKKKKEEKEKIKKGNISHISIAGQKGMLIHVAKCCNPQPGDKVGAYLAPNRSAVLHKLSCDNFKKISEKFPEKVIDASWGN